MPISKHIQRLREKVGTELLQEVSASAVCYDKHQQLLMVQHSQTGLWSIPGGNIDLGETPADAVVREVYEESGLRVVPKHVIGLFGGPEFHDCYPDGNEVCSVDTIFDCQLVDGTPQIRDAEIASIRFVSKSDLDMLPLKPWMAEIRPLLFSTEDVRGSLTKRTASPALTHFYPAGWRPPIADSHEGGPSDYIRQLRTRIGTDLIVMPAAAGVVYDPKGNILLQQRSDTGEWGFPGGAIDPLEHPADAALREVWEETGIVAEIEAISGIYCGPDSFHTYPHGDQIFLFTVVFRCKAIGGRLHADLNESLQVGFFSEEEMPPVDRYATKWLAAMKQWEVDGGFAHFDPPGS